MQLTWARIAVAPAFVILLWNANTEVWRAWICAAIFICASITDYFDGMLARKYHAQSNLGKFMDPIADKILVATVLIMLIPSGKCHPLMAIVLLTRDILIGGIRSVAAADQVVIDAKAAGKWKTGIQMVGVPAVLLDLNLPFEVSGAILSTDLLGSVLLWLSVVLSVLSGYQYTMIYLEKRKDEGF